MENSLIDKAERQSEAPLYNRPAFLGTELVVNGHPDANPILVLLGQVHELIEHFSNFIFGDVLDGLFRFLIAIIEGEVDADQLLDKIGVEWSKKRGNYDKKGNWNQWRHFKRSHPNPLTIRSLIREFRERRAIQSHAQAFDEFDEMAAAKEAEVEQQDAYEYYDGPDHVLTIPGILQDVVNFYNENSMVEQPAFAVMAALGLGSVVLGRNVRTDMNNYSSIYMIAVGDTGAGKETIATVLTHILQECGLDSLVGPEDFTSEGRSYRGFWLHPRLF